MSAPSQNRPGLRKAYRVALIGYFREECTVLARNEEEAEELACNIGDWETVYQEGAIVKSGVWAFWSGGGLGGLCCFHSVFEAYAGNDLGQMIEAS